MIKTLYGRLRTFLPQSTKGKVSRFLYLAGIKPTVSNQKSNLDKGVIVLSADFEMAWAFRYAKTQSINAVKLGIQERENVPVLVSLFEKYNIPVTWATVGHLFLDKCDCENTKAHPQMLRPAHFENRNWRFNQGDWYDNDPCTDYKSDPAWYAPDLIDLIIQSPVKHEVACHTFSHIDFSDKNCNEKLAVSEIDACVSLAKLKGVKLTSMVFPGGTYGNIKTLKKFGFTSYRHPMKYDICMPKMDKDGLLAIPSSTGLDKDPYGWSATFHINMIKKYIRKTIVSKQVCHFWFHPSMNKWYLEEVFPKILNEINKEQQLGNIEVLTMHQLTEKYIKNA